MIKDRLARERRKSDESIRNVIKEAKKLANLNGNASSTWNNTKALNKIGEPH